MKKLISLLIILCMIFVSSVPVVFSAQAVYPDIVAVQNDEGTFINMNGNLICELKGNRYLRFRSTDADDNWIASECRGADLCIAYADEGVKGIVIETADFTNNPDEGWFEIAVTGYKDGLDCNVEYTVRGIWNSDIGKFKYSYTTSMDANLEKWYESSKVAQNYYNKNPNSTAPIEITDYHVENISYPDINNSTSYKDTPQRYEWFLYSEDGTDWEKFPKVYIPYPTRDGDYLTIRKNGARGYEGLKFGFTDSRQGGWMTTVTHTTGGINYELCWYFFDVHVNMYNAVPKRGSSERFSLSFGLDFEPVSAEEGTSIVNSATERNWRELEEYALPLFSRNNTFDTLISDDVIPSEETAEHYIWWASSYDCYRDDTVGYDDNYSASIKRTSNSPQPVAWNTYTWGRPFEKDSTSNHRYRISAMVKTQDCTGPVRLAYGGQKNHADLFYGVGTHLSDGTPREDIISWQYSDSVTGTNDWTPISMEVTIDYYVNSIILEMNGKGQCWFDNVVIEDLGAITAEDYYIYDDFENGKNDKWTINDSGVGIVENGALVLTLSENATTFARAERAVKGYGGKWIADMDVTVNTRLGTVLAAASVFNIEVSGANLLVKSGDSNFNRIDTKFDTAYVQGTPFNLKVVMDFDTKAFELWYNGTKVNLGTGNYIRSGTVEKLSSMLSKVDYGYEGDITIDKFMLYSDTDKGAVNIAREDLKLNTEELYKENIVLPETGINGTNISWQSSNEAVIKKDGTVKRAYEEKSAILTATISKNSVSSQKSFSLGVAPYMGLTFTSDSLVALASSTNAKISVSKDDDKRYKSPVLILACYSGNKLIGTDICDVDLIDEKIQYSLTASHSEAADRVEIFLMDKFNFKPVTKNLSYRFTAQPVVEFDTYYAQVNETVGFDVFEVMGGVSIPLSKGGYTLSSDGMNVDYDAKTVSFSTGGLKTINITTSNGVASASLVVNDSTDRVSVEGDIQFESDFATSGALGTYYGSGNAYSITNDASGNPGLTTAASNTSDTLLFGPSLSDYTVEMDFTPTSLSGSGVNTIAIGMRAKSANDRQAYRVTLAERWKFDGTNVLYNRLAIGRSKSSNAAEGYYAKYSDEPYTSKFELNKKYKLSASICGNKIYGTLYDADGNVLESIVSETGDCDYDKNNNALTALSSGKTLIAFHCMVAKIHDIKIYDYDTAGEIRLEASETDIDVGDSISLSAFAGNTPLENGMVNYTALSGFEISGNNAIATQEGIHTIVAEYTDYAGKTKYAITEVQVR